MKTAIIATLFAGTVAAGLSAPLAYAGPATITLNGESAAVRPGDELSGSCNTGHGSVSPTDMIIQVSDGQVGDIGQARITSSGKVVYLAISGHQGQYGLIGTEQGGPLQGGDASVVMSGKSYQITGHASRLVNDAQSTTGAPVPFEFDVTCE